MGFTRNLKLLYGNNKNIMIVTTFTIFVRFHKKKISIIDYQRVEHCFKNEEMHAFRDVSNLIVSVMYRHNIGFYFLPLIYVYESLSNKYKNITF